MAHSCSLGLHFLLFSFLPFSFAFFLFFLSFMATVFLFCLSVPLSEVNVISRLGCVVLGYEVLGREGVGEIKVEQLAS